MNNQSTTTISQSKKWQSWLVLFLRWLLGGLAGIGISVLIYLDFLTSTNMIPILCGMPFIGQYYLLNYLIYSSTYYGNYTVIFPALIWGVIGALLASGRKKQIIAGRTLLLLYVIGGIGAYFLAALLLVPT